MQESKKAIIPKRIFNAAFVFVVIVYGMFLARAILFKYVSPLGLFSADRFFTRGVNWIPFGGHEYRHLLKQDVIINLLLFAPFGFLLAMATKESPKRGVVLLIPLITSAALETLQYVLSVGATDITDVITNTLGALCGYIVYILSVKLFKNRQKLDRVYIVLMFFVACPVFIFLVI